MFKGKTYHEITIAIQYKDIFLRVNFTEQDVLRLWKAYIYPLFKYTSEQRYHKDMSHIFHHDMCRVGDV